MRLPAGGEERRLLEPYRAESSGGELEVTLTVEQMPSHRHRISTNNKTSGIHDGLGGGSYPDRGDYGILRNFADIRNKPSWDTVLPNVLEPTGGSRPHPNMPPYIALYFCKKNRGS